MASSMGIPRAKDWAKAALRLPPVDSIGLAGDKMPSKSKEAIESFAGFIYSCLSNHLLTLHPETQEALPQGALLPSQGVHPPCVIGCSCSAPLQLRTVCFSNPTLSETDWLNNAAAGEEYLIHSR